MDINYFDYADIERLEQHAEDPYANERVKASARALLTGFKALCAARREHHKLAEFSGSLPVAEPAAGPASAHDSARVLGDPRPVRPWNPVGDLCRSIVGPPA